MNSNQRGANRLAERRREYKSTTQVQGKNRGGRGLGPGPLPAGASHPTPDISHVVTGLDLGRGPERMCLRCRNGQIAQRDLDAGKGAPLLEHCSASIVLRDTKYIVGSRGSVAREREREGGTGG